MYILLSWLVVLLVISIVKGCRKTFQVAYYETLLQRYENEVGIKLPENYKKVKNEFWFFLK